MGGCVSSRSKHDENSNSSGPQKNQKQSLPWRGKDISSKHRIDSSTDLEDFGDDCFRFCCIGGGESMISYRYDHERMVRGSSRRAASAASETSTVASSTSREASGDSSLMMLASQRSRGSLTSARDSAPRTSIPLTPQSSSDSVGSKKGLESLAKPVLDTLESVPVSPRASRIVRPLELEILPQSPTERRVAYSSSYEPDIAVIPFVQSTSGSLCVPTEPYRRGSSVSPPWARKSGTYESPLTPTLFTIEEDTDVVRL
eukprot:GEMP01045999.1.p1 GENE.GEMP01045999.1~~GEMP01045999.1.p1  ORF type:complete len:258 (+),score=46.49 GEMP01045999.1:322-1095(+)